MDMRTFANDANDRLVGHILGAQIHEVGAFDDGGLMIMEKGFAESGRDASAADALISAYYSPDSRYCGDPKALRAALLSLKHLLASTHEDGTIDLLETNFHDATCNGFAVQVLGYTHRLVKAKTAGTALEGEVFDALHQFLLLSAKAMCEGGFHTPNHRWVLASALSICANELGDRACLDMAKFYLAEGIDCDEEGEYTERSPAIYDGVCNYSMMIMACELDDPSFADHVLRNLDKIAHYIEPDGSVLTLNSRRQDSGKRMEAYRHILPCALAVGMPHGEGDARHILAGGLLGFLTERYAGQMAGMQPPQDVGPILTWLLLRPDLAVPLSAPSLPVSFEKLYPKAGVLRRRAGGMALTLIEKQSTFMKIQVGRIEMLVRLCGSFYAKGQFKADAIEPVDGGYRMRYSYQWGYVRPLGEAVGTPVWADMPHRLRENVNMLTWTWDVTVRADDERVQIHVAGDGCDRLPWKLECALTAGGMLAAETGFVPGSPDGWIVHEGKCSYRLGNDELCIEGGKKDHWYGPNMRGSEPPLPGWFTMYAAGFAPVDETMVFTWASR